MKYVVVALCCALIAVTQAKVLPDALTALACHKNDPDYEKCVWDGFEKARPNFVNGIPEVNFPAIDPFELPLMTVDRTVNELVSIKAVMKNIRMIGGADTIIEGIRANPFNHSGEIRVTIPFVNLEMDYDVNGQLLVVPLRSKGHFAGNFTDTKLVIRGNLKLVDKNGVKYFRVDKLSVKSRVGDGRINLKAHNPELQFAAELISNFYNENPRLVMDAINPIYVDTAAEFFRVVSDQILGSAPAKEWLPE